MEVERGTPCARWQCHGRCRRRGARGVRWGSRNSQMPRYATQDGKGTNDSAKALQSNGRPVDNAARNVWVTETVLATALDTSYMASQVALLGIVVGVALLLSGFGFAILAIGGALRNPESPLNVIFGKRMPEAPLPAPLPSA